MTTRARSDRRTRGFTLVELLVVITIIAILVGLTSVAVVRAIATARQTGMKTEIDQLDLAMKAYKERYGSFPPSNLGFNDPNLNMMQRNVLLGVIRQHVAQAFPRYDLNHLQNDLANTGLDLENFRPDQALYFWLRGFNSDPQHPFVNVQNQPLNNGTPGAAVKLVSLFEFDPTRLMSVDGTGAEQPVTAHMASYFPKGGTPGIDSAPFVYWDSRSYSEQGNPVVATPDASKPGYYFNGSDMSKGSPGHSQTASGNSPPNVLFRQAGTLVPYLLDTNRNGMLDPGDSWANPESFQILCSGGDRKFGVATVTMANEQRLYPAGLNYDVSTLADDDNVTNFSQSSRIGDEKP